MRSNLNHWKGRKKYYNKNKIGVVLVWLSLIVIIGCQSDQPGSTIEAAAPSEMKASLENYNISLEEIKTRGVLRVGTAITEPFEFHDPESGELIGFDVELMLAIAERLGVEIEWIEMSFANLIPTVQEEKVDVAIAAIHINPEREKLVDFSDPYIYTGLVMVVRPEDYVRIKSVEDLAGLVVGVKIGATGARLAEKLLGEGIPLEIKEYRETKNSLLELEVGRVDVVFNDYFNTLSFIQGSDLNLKMVIDESGEINFLSNVGLGIAIPEGEHELLLFINHSLDEMKQSGEIDQLTETWIFPSVKE